MKPKSQAPAVDSKSRARIYNAHKQKELQPANVKHCQEGGVWNSPSSGHRTSPEKKHNVAKIPSCMQECMCTGTVIRAILPSRQKVVTSHYLDSSLTVRDRGLGIDWPFFILMAAKQNTVFIYVTWMGAVYSFKLDDIAYQHIFCSDKFMVLVDHTSDQALGLSDGNVTSASTKICWPLSQAQLC